MSDFTVSGWMKITSWPVSWVNIVAKKEDEANGEFCFRLKGSSKGQLYHGNGERPIGMLEWVPSEHVVLNEWVHFAITRKLGECYKLYLDGVVRYIKVLEEGGAPKSVNTPVEIMGMLSNQKVNFGYLSELLLCDRTLSSGEIRVSLLTGMEEELMPASPCKVYPKKKRGVDLVPKSVKLRKHQYAESILSLDYQELLRSMVDGQEASVVVIGANDGKFNDPIYPFIRDNARSVKLLLVEPQKEVLPYLIENYSFHENKVIANMAIGRGKEEIVLYSIKNDYWDRLNVPYAEKNGWALYRAPTGVASTIKNHVIKWLEKHMVYGDPEDAIQETNVYCAELEQVMEKTGFERSVDILQIDAEGYDDEVIYACSIKKMLPKIIFFENKHIVHEKKEKLYCYIKSAGYHLHEVGENSIALRL